MMRKQRASLVTLGFGALLTIGCQGLLGIEDGTLRKDDEKPRKSQTKDAGVKEPKPSVFKDAGADAAVDSAASPEGPSDAGEDMDSGAQRDSGIPAMDAGTDSGAPPVSEPILVTINEVVSTGGDPGDWVELYNAGENAADLTGYLFKDGSDDNVYMLPSGSTVSPGGFLVIEQAELGFALGSDDAARLFALDGLQVVDAYSWKQHAATSYGACPDGSDAWRETTAVTKGAANDCSAKVVINEIESSDGDPGDWVELHNTSLNPLDVSGYVFRDDDDTHAYIIANGTVIAPGRYLVLEEADLGFGFGGADSARLYLPDGTTLIDSYSWVSHAPRSYGRCPAGGAFVSLSATSKGGANVCDGEVGVQTWPDASPPTPADAVNVLGKNISGLSFEPGATAAGDVLWAVKNDPSELHRLVLNGGVWGPDGAEWSAGKSLKYTDGAGSPDAEGVTRGNWLQPGIYVATERDNHDSEVSRQSVLRYEESVAAAWTATHEWNLTADLPQTEANQGLEGIAWLPDAFLVAGGYYDERLNKTFNPTDYPGHGDGLFVVGLEATGMLYVFALNEVGSAFLRVASVVSDNAKVNGLEFDRDEGYLMAYCGAGCGDIASIIGIDATPGSPTLGRFVVKKKLLSPNEVTLGATEGIAFAPAARCAAGSKAFFWADDAATNNHALLGGAISCGTILP